MAPLYANENFPLPVVECLRRLGHEVLTASEAGRANQAIPDEEVLEFATREGRAVLTLNRKDFISLHRRSSRHAGIIVCTFNPNFAALAEKIQTAIESAGRLDGQLLRINRGA
ncbi:MAG: DUF5615 family PIN-like protein [Actinomycetota bacterium]